MSEERSLKDGDRLFTRRDAGLLCGAGLLLPQHALAQTGSLNRAIPHGSGENLPIVGLGTSQVFDVGSDPKDREGLIEVVRALVDGGGTLIDTAPSYGEAEAVVGDILATTGLRPRVFIATKLEYYRSGRYAVEAHASIARLKTPKLDLLQLHNVSNPNQDMSELNALKAQGTCRYTGITTTFDGDYAAVEMVTRRARPDFLQVDYAIDNREAEQRVLPAAIDAGTAVLVALPFGRGQLFRAALGKRLPDFAAELDCVSWGQFFLKFILGHPAVTAVIPGTDKAAHMRDNLGAARGRLPDAKERERMAQYISSF